MDNLREGIGFQGYAQNDPLIEYRTLAFQTFQDLVADIQEDIVRNLMHVQIQAVEQPTAAEVPEAAMAATAPVGGRADRNNKEEMSPELAPAARPAAAAASAALARSQLWNRGNVGTNVTESVGGETRQVGGPAAGTAGGEKTGKIGRNSPCFCGSGKKYKYCHGK
jgi:preprotein translocase subunit SecA